MKKCEKYLLMFLSSLLLLASTSYASITDDEINSIYGKAEHQTWQWQSINDGDGPSNEYNGISWSINGEAFGNSLFNLDVNDTIQFQIVMKTNDLGNHNLNLSKTWLDLDGSGSFDDDEAISFFTYTVNKTNPLLQNNDYTNDWIGKYVVSDGNNDSTGTILTDSSTLVDSITTTTPGVVTFKSDIIDIADINLYAGNFYLRSRVTCSETLASDSSYGNQWNLLSSLGDQNSAIAEYYNLFKATGSLYQGEMEQYKFTVDGTPPTTPTPEPATMLLFGIGLVGLSGFMRRKKK